MSEVLALSIRQPWAELILEGRKQVELRNWRKSYRGLMWLHAGAKADERLLKKFGFSEPPFRGGYVGTVRLVSIVPLDPVRWDAWRSLHLGGPYEPGYFGWVLSDPVRFKEPISAKGQLGLFSPDNAMKAKLVVAAERQS